MFSTDRSLTKIPKRGVVYIQPLNIFRYLIHGTWLHLTRVVQPRHTYTAKTYGLLGSRALRALLGTKLREEKNVTD